MTHGLLVYRHELADRGVAEASGKDHAGVFLILMVGFLGLRKLDGGEGMSGKE